MGSSQVKMASLLRLITSTMRRRLTWACRKGPLDRFTAGEPEQRSSNRRKDENPRPVHVAPVR
jgi:hypothetical protein